VYLDWKKERMEKRREKKAKKNQFRQGGRQAEEKVG
jgi:hypothetical protein